MPHIQLTTRINASAQLVFNLARSIDLHQESMRHTNEKAIGGRLSGLIEVGETVTWQARHLGRTRILTVKITAMNPYTYFKDEMVKGDFTTMLHHHSFYSDGDTTLMTDEFYFTSPYGFLGRITNTVFLTNYMKHLLQKRNLVIKQYAESERWKTVL